MVTMFQQLFPSVWNERKIMGTWTESTLDNKRPHYTCPFNTHTHALLTWTICTWTCSICPMPILPSFDKIKHYIRGLCFLGILWLEEQKKFGFCFGVVDVHLSLLFWTSLFAHMNVLTSILIRTHVLEESQKLIVHGSSSPSLLPYHFIKRKKQCKSIGNLCPRWDYLYS